MTKHWPLSIVLLLSLAALAQENVKGKLAPELRVQRAHKGAVHVIVQFKHSLNSGHQEKIHARGGMVNAELGIVKAVAATLPANALATLANDDDVAYISPDRPLKPTSTNQITQQTVEPMDQTPTFRVTVVSRTVQAVNYRQRGGATTLGFKGTELMPAAHAQARGSSPRNWDC